MTETVTRSNGSNGARATTKLDAVVVGAGVAGLYQLFRLREQGLSVKAIDAGSSVGGTWYWNRYPGIACDVEAYSYLPLLEEMGYVPSMKFASGFESLEYCQKMAEKFGMPIVSFVDTQGAYPGVDAEERGQPRAIADNLEKKVIPESVMNDHLMIFKVFLHPDALDRHVMYENNYAAADKAINAVLSKGALRWRRFTSV